MRLTGNLRLELLATTILAVAPVSAVLAQSGVTPTSSQSGEAKSASTNDADEIIVTAQKKSERLNDVPIAVTAATGDTLRTLGISDVAQLTKLVPSFQASQTYNSVPTYTLRGVGFYSATFGARSTVGIYQDEVELPFAIMAKGSTLDLQRVEVLKGPQGILFGQNVTGGLINYVAAKPTQDLAYGGTAEFGRFDRGNVEGYVSGPLSDTLSVRIAGRHEYGEGWQSSYTRDDKLGRKNLTTARLLVDWKPSSVVRVELNLNGWNDKSDTQAAQFLEINERIPGGLAPAVLNYPKSPQTPTAADWGLTSPSYANDLKFRQAALRIDAELGKIGTLTSLSAYSDLRGTIRTDSDGTQFNVITTDDQLVQSSASQEVRLAGNIGDRISYLVGGSYAWYRADQSEANEFPDGSAGTFFSAFGIPGTFTGSNTFVNARYETVSAFANLDTKLSDQLTLHTGIRYSETTGHAVGCTSTPGAVGATGFTFLLNALRGFAEPLINVAPGGCYSVDDQGLPGFANPTLKEHSVPFRVGLDWKPARDTLLYINLSRGFKGGSFPVINSSKLAQNEPARQEQLTSFEGGVKVALLQRRLQFNAAVFHYKYNDKQITGAFVDQVFGPLPQLVNVPKSTVNGAEVELNARPFDGLSVRGTLAYTHTEIDGCSSSNSGPATGVGCFSGQYYNFDSLGNLINLTGREFPLSPKWTGSISADYNWKVKENLSAFVGGDVYAQSSTLGQLGVDRGSANSFQQDLVLSSYATVDVRVGISGSNDKWRFSIWGRNVTNKYYRTAAQYANDVMVVWTGLPVTYGASLSFNY